MLPANVVIKQVKKFPIYDVFHGEEGWEPQTWSRILIKNGKGVLIAGEAMAISLLKAIVKQVRDKNAPTSTSQ